MLRPVIVLALQLPVPPTGEYTAPLTTGFPLKFAFPFVPMFPLVVEATGSPSGFALAQQMTEPRGTLVLKSTFHGAAPVETWPLVVKEITLVGSRCGPFDKAIALLRSGKVNPAPLISHEFPLRNANRAIAYAQKPGVMKVVLRNDLLASKKPGNR